MTLLASLAVPIVWLCFRVVGLPAERRNTLALLLAVIPAFNIYSAVSLDALVVTTASLFLLGLLVLMRRPDAMAAGRSALHGRLHSHQSSDLRRSLPAGRRRPAGLSGDRAGKGLPRGAGHRGVGGCAGGARAADGDRAGLPSRPGLSDRLEAGEPRRLPRLRRAAGLLDHADHGRGRDRPVPVPGLSGNSVLPQNAGRLLAGRSATTLWRSRWPPRRPSVRCSWRGPTRTERPAGPACSSTPSCC